MSSSLCTFALQIGSIVKIRQFFTPRLRSSSWMASSSFMFLSVIQVATSKFMLLFSKTVLMAEMVLSKLKILFLSQLWLSFRPSKLIVIAVKPLSAKAENRSWLNNEPLVTMPHVNPNFEISAPNSSISFRIKGSPPVITICGRFLPILSFISTNSFTIN